MCVCETRAGAENEACGRKSQTPRSQAQDRDPECNPEPESVGLRTQREDRDEKAKRGKKGRPPTQKPRETRCRERGPTRGRTTIRERQGNRRGPEGPRAVVASAQVSQFRRDESAPEGPPSVPVLGQVQPVGVKPFQGLLPSREAPWAVVAPLRHVARVSSLHRLLHRAPPL